MMLDRRRAARILLALAAAVVGSCARKEQPSDIAGTWRIELTSGMGWNGQRAAEGTMHLKPEPMPDSLCAVDKELVCSSQVRGPAAISTIELLGGQLLPTAVGGIATNGEIVVVIGGCCDRG